MSGGKPNADCRQRRIERDPRHLPQRQARRVASDARSRPGDRRRAQLRGDARGSSIRKPASRPTIRRPRRAPGPVGRVAPPNAGVAGVAAAAKSVLPTHRSCRRRWCWYSPRWRCVWRHRRQTGGWSSRTDAESRVDGDVGTTETEADGRRVSSDRAPSPPIEVRSSTWKCGTRMTGTNGRRGPRGARGRRVGVL